MYRTAVLTAIAVTFVSSAFAAPGDKVDGKSEKAATPKFDEFSDPSTIREALQKERRKVESQKAELEQLKIDLKAAEAKLDEKLQQIKQATEAKNKILEKIEQRNKSALGQKLDRLVKLSEKMPPPEAAAYLAKLDSRTASRILQGMRLRQASKVMAALPPKKAATLSRVYLKNDEPIGRRTDPDKPKR